MAPPPHELEDITDVPRHTLAHYEVDVAPQPPVAIIAAQHSLDHRREIGGIVVSGVQVVTRVWSILAWLTLAGSVILFAYGLAGIGRLLESLGTQNSTSSLAVLVGILSPLLFLALGPFTIWAVLKSLYEIHRQNEQILSSLSPKAVPSQATPVAPHMRPGRDESSEPPTVRSSLPAPHVERLSADDRAALSMYFGGWRELNQEERVSQAGLLVDRLRPLVPEERQFSASDVEFLVALATALNVLPKRPGR